MDVVALVLCLIDLSSASLCLWCLASLSINVLHHSIFAPGLIGTTKKYAVCLGC